MQRWIAALLLLLVGGPLLLATACGGGGATKAELSGTVPPGWNKHASSEGLTLTIPPGSGPVSGAVEFLGTISPELRSRGDKITIQLWPEGSFRDLGKVGESKYKGQVGPSTTTVQIRSAGGYKGNKNDVSASNATATYVSSLDGTFGGMMKLPHVIQVGDELRLVEPGRHYLALVLDDKHAVYAPFEIAPPPVLPTPSLAPYLSLGSFQFLDSQTGWLSASSCRNQPRPTPDEYSTAPTGPPTCKSGFYGTTDGGQTWSLLSHDGVGPFVMDGSGGGLAAGGFCDSPCNNSVLRTKDGGRHWSQTYTSTLWLTDLTLIDGEAWLLGNTCAYGDSCARYLLKSTDGGSTWSKTTLPITGDGISLCRPTKHDAWMASSSEGAHAQPAEIKVTHDGGQTWTSLPHPTGFAAGEEIVFRTAQQGWLLISGLPGAGNQWKDLFGTEDGGATWTHLSGPQPRDSVEDGGERLR